MSELTRVDLDALREAIHAAAPLLVEHGRQQEREKWEARIEKLADKWDRGGEVVGGALPPAARELRSLLTGEDD